MRFGLFWQTPGSAESSVARRHWETIKEIVLGEQLGFETAWHEFRLHLVPWHQLHAASIEFGQSPFNLLLPRGLNLLVDFVLKTFQQEPS